MMNITFRTDATSQIGTGHFMRCLTLADALRQRGAQIRFVSRDLPAYLSDMLAARDLEFVPLGSAAAEYLLDNLAHSNWLGTSQAQDARDTAEALADRKWDWLVVDHYALDARWESVMRDTAGKIMAIDDLADRKHDCDVLLDQNYYSDMQTRYAGKVPEHCRLLLGPRYALLREEFRKLREQVKPRTGEVSRILVFFGGVDTGNFTGQAIHALALSNLKAMHVDVVIGAQHPYREQIVEESSRENYSCHVQTSRMAELMLKADLAIGASGAASWERCCLGLPALVVAVAQNQIKIAKDLELAHAISVIPNSITIPPQFMVEHITNLIAYPEKIADMSRSCLQLVDGQGTIRVLDQLTEL